jgi:uncharacterized RDD family membrane protein YckC
MSESENEALKRLEQDYLRGAIDAEEYARLRSQVMSRPSSTDFPPPSPQQPTYVQPTHVQPAQTQTSPAYADTTAPYYATDVDPITQARLAGWGRRVAALLLDALVYVIAFIPTIVWSATTADPATDEISDAAAGVLVAQGFFLPFLYTWIMHGVWGQTLGKMALGIAVRRGEDAARIGFARALGRSASVLVLGIITIPLLLSYLWPLWDGRNQTIHDKMAGTIVVKL